jgi:hypothetical protein
MKPAPTMSASAPLIVTAQMMVTSQYIGVGPAVRFGIPE